MSIRFRPVFFTIVLIIILFPYTTKADPGNAFVFSYFAGIYGDILEQHLDFGNYNKFWIKDTEDRTYEAYATIITKPGVEPSIDLRFLETYYQKNRVISPGGGVSGLVLYAEISYHYEFRKIHPAALPDMVIGVMYDYNVEISVNYPSPICAHQATAKLYIGDQFGKEWQVDCLNPAPIKNQGIQYNGLYNVSDEHEIRMSCRLYIKPSYDQYEAQATARVLLDPLITIDPNYMVTIEGVEYRANELYEVVLSKNLYVEPPPFKPLPHIPLLLLDD